MIRRWVLALIAVGLAVRVGIALTVTGNSYDLESTRLVDLALRRDPLTLYETGRWPYPPGFVPWILIARELADLAGAISFAAWVKLPSMLADAALAFIVVAHLAWRGASDRLQLLALVTIALGPAFIIISSHETQLDSVATLPAVLALVVWERRPDWVHRGLAVGALLGVGGLLKTVPLLLVVAFLPAARSWRERVSIVVAAVAVPVIALSPWLLHDLSGTVEALRYSGLPGVGGLSLVVQPDIAEATLLTGTDVRYSAANRFFLENGLLVFAPFYLMTSLFLHVNRVPPAVGAAIVWLTFYAFAPNFFFQYLIWGIPFFLLARQAVTTTLFVAVMAVPHAIFVLRPWEQPWIAHVYAALMIATWAAYVGALALLARRAALASRDAPSGELTA